jgi:4'-phosphopantetheinyl transferase
MNITHSDFQIANALALPEDEVQLWRVDLEAIRGEEKRWRSFLSADERIRADRFHFERDRQLFIASRALLRIILAAYLAGDPHDLTFEYSQKQKPSLASASGGGDLMFNISHSGDIALFAFTHGREIGIDVEKIRRDFDLEAIARRFFSANEQAQLAALPNESRPEAFFRCWTRKEAYMKATGDGLSLPLHQFDVSIAESASNALLATRPDGAEAARWSLRDVQSPSGYAAALCVRGHDWKLKAE